MAESTPPPGRGRGRAGHLLAAASAGSPRLPPPTRTPGPRPALSPLSADMPSLGAGRARPPGPPLTSTGTGRPPASVGPPGPVAVVRHPEPSTPQFPQQPPPQAPPSVVTVIEERTQDFSTSSSSAGVDVSGLTVSGDRSSSSGSGSLPRPKASVADPSLRDPVGAAEPTGIGRGAGPRSQPRLPPSPPVPGEIQVVEPQGDPNTKKEYRGTDGKATRVSANYLRLEMEKGRAIYEYAVSYDPVVDNRNERFKLINQHRAIIGPEKSFDGVKLYLPNKLPDVSTVAEGQHSETGEAVKISINFKQEKNAGDREIVQFFNILFSRIFRALDFSQDKKRNYYDAKGAVLIKQHGLEVWPGYVTAVENYEGGLLLQIDVSSRVLRTETVRDVLVRHAKSHAEAEKALLGASVITRYNNKSYKVDELDFTKTPKDTFTNAKGEEISYMDYYQRQYGIEVKDRDQPMIVNRPKKKDQAVEDGVEKLICLIPELCYMTGMTDAMRQDFKLMKDVAVHTRVSPSTRQMEMGKFVRRVLDNETARKMLQGWGLAMSEKPILLDARILSPERIHFGGKYSEMVGPKADWGRAATTRPCLTAIHITKWGLVFPGKNKEVVQAFCRSMQQNAVKMGIQISMPKVVALDNDRTETYLKGIRELLDAQLVMAVVPQVKADRYAGIKKLCCIERPVASQVIVLKTIMNDKRLASVAQKVVLQLNCKMGGELWACQTPFKNLMVVGIDVFHDKSRQSGSIAAVVSTLNDNMSRYYSTVAFQRQGQELVDALKIEFIGALMKYYDVNHYLPENIVVFRDGVGDGDLDRIKVHEVGQFASVFKHVKTDPKSDSQLDEKLRKLFPKGYDPGLNFVVVQKRINTRIFRIGPGGPPNSGGTFENPDPGTIVDHTVTRYSYYDFFLVPQSVTQGTVTPTHFIDLHQAGKNYLDANQVQKLAYRLSHMYFNWPGTVRVPAPCQYAHKLCDLVGENLHSVPSPQLADRLYYL